MRSVATLAQRRQDLGSEHVDLIQPTAAPGRDLEVELRADRRHLVLAVPTTPGDAPNPRAPDQPLADRHRVARYNPLLRIEESRSRPGGKPHDARAVAGDRGTGAPPGYRDEWPEAAGSQPANRRNGRAAATVNLVENQDATPGSGERRVHCRQPSLPRSPGAASPPVVRPALVPERAPQTAAAPLALSGDRIYSGYYK